MTATCQRLLHCHPQPRALARSYTDMGGRITGVYSHDRGSHQQIWTRYRYDALNQITEVLDTDSNAIRASYDNLGRRIKVTSPDAGTVQYAFDAQGRLATRTKADGRIITHQYDKNRLTQIQYPPVPRNQGVTPATGELYRPITVRYTYGSKDAAALPEAQRINGAGRIIATEDQAGLHQQRYGKLGETIEETHSLIRPNPAYPAGAAGPAQTQIPATISDSYTTKMVWDSWGRIRKLQYPDTRILHTPGVGSTSTPLGGTPAVPAQYTLTPGETLTYQYDGGGLLQSIAGQSYQSRTVSEGSTPPAPVPQGSLLTYLSDIQYDEYGQRTKVSYGSGVTENYQYDPHRRWLNTKRTTGPNLYGGTTAGVQAGAPTSRVLQSLSYQFDPLGNISTLRNDADALAKDQQTQGLPLLGSTVQRFEYDDFSRLIEARGQRELNTGSATAPQAGVDTYVQRYTYSPLHNLMSQSLAHTPVSGQTVQQLQDASSESGKVQTQLYRYQGPRPHAPSQIGKVFYHYDANGNRSHWGEQQDAPDQHAVWDDENRLQRLSTGGGSGEAGGATTRQQRDSNNPTGQAHESGGATSTRDLPPLGCDPASSANPTATQPGRTGYCPPDSSTPTAQYQYDAAGTRQVKRTSANAGYDTLYLNPWITVQVPQQKAPSGGNEAAARQQEKRSQYVMDGDTRFIAKLNLPTQSCQKRINPQHNATIPQDRDFTLFHTHTDHLGSVSLLTDECGETVEQNHSLPYGLPWSSDSSTDPNSNSQTTATGQGNTAQDYGYTGKEEDSESGFIYYGARYYDPRASVWMSADPIWEKYLDGFNGGYYDARNLSLYGQSFNNPVSYKDPDGNVVGKIGSAVAKKGAREVTEYATERALKTARGRAVDAAWAMERKLVKEGHPGTVKWNKKERNQLLKEGKVSGYEGHHTKTVKSTPEEAGNPDYIKFAKGRKEHLEQHGGNFKNDGTGEKIDRSAGGKIARDYDEQGYKIGLAGRVDKLQQGAADIGLQATIGVLSATGVVLDALDWLDPLNLLTHMPECEGSCGDLPSKEAPQQ